MRALHVTGLALAIGLVASSAGRAQVTGPEAEATVRVHLVPEPRAEARGPVPEPGPVNIEGPAPTVGDPFWVTVQTSGPAGYGLLPASLIEALDERPEVRVSDTDRRDGRLRLEIVSFRPGDAALPEVRAVVVSGAGDTLRVPVTSDTVRVARVLAPADTVLAGIKPLWTERGIPAWVWWAVAAIVATTLLLAWWWRRRRPGEPAAVTRRRRGAYAVARRRIEKLREEPVTPEAGIAAAAGIGDALREYLAGGWGVPAHERTTFELLGALPVRLARCRPALGAVLNRADLAKFARVVPRPGAVPKLGGRALATLDDLESARTEAVGEEAGSGEEPVDEGPVAESEREEAS